MTHKSKVNQAPPLTSPSSYPWNSPFLLRGEFLESLIKRDDVMCVNQFRMDIRQEGSLSLFSPSQTLAVTPFFSFFFLSEGWFRVNFDPKITPPNCFSLYPNWISDFTYFLFSFVCFCDSVVSERLCLFWFSVFVRCVFDFPS